jgi:uncharacterized protein
LSLRESLTQPMRVTRPLRRLLGLLAVAALGLALWVGSGLLVPLTLAPLQAPLTSFVTIFLGIFIEALPFLLAGTLVSSALHLFVSDAALQRLCPRRPVPAAAAGGLLGLLFPVCECGSVPATRRLIAKGAPLPLGLAFMLASPVINPVVIASTWVAFNGDPLLVGGRIGLTLLVAVGVGLLVGLHPRPASALMPVAADKEHGDHEHAGHDHAGCDHDHGHTHHAAGEPSGVGAKAAAVLRHTGAELFEMSRFLVIGGLLAAAMQTLVPQSVLLSLGQGPVISVLVMMLLAVVLSICSTVDAFVALAFTGLFAPGAVLAFLVFGPMVDIKSVLLYSSTFRSRTVALIVLLCAQMILVAGIAVNLGWG